MKILHILSTPRAEGTPNLVLDWLATGREEQEVFVLHDQPADLTEKLRAGAHWYGEEKLFARGKSKFFAIAASVERVCRERQPDLVVCWPTGFANWAGWGARRAGVRRLLVHCGNPPNRGFRADWITRYVMWPLAGLGAHCICCSDYVRLQYQAVPGVAPRLFHTVYNSVRTADVARRADAARRDRPPAPGKIGIMVATLERHKDHATLIAALPIILERQPDFRLQLVGDGSLLAKLQALAQDRSVAHAISFLRTRTDVPELLGRADIFIFSTTTQEGLGSVLLEALAADLPVVASDVPACRETLAGGRYGTLVPPHDPGALAQAVLAALREEPADRPEARAYALTFSPEAMMDAYLALAADSSENRKNSAAEGRRS